MGEKKDEKRLLRCFGGRFFGFPVEVGVVLGLGDDLLRLDLVLGRGGRRGHERVDPVVDVSQSREIFLVFALNLLQVVVRRPQLLLQLLYFSLKIRFLNH